MTDEYDTAIRELKEHESRGVKIKAKIKRGTDTRDQDELVIEAKDPNPAIAADKFADALENIKPWAEYLRKTQPEQ